MSLFRFVCVCLEANIDVDMAVWILCTHAKTYISILAYSCDGVYMKYLAAADTYNYVNKSTSKIKVFPRISVISEVKINQEKETKRRKKERKKKFNVTSRRFLLSNWPPGDSQRFHARLMQRCRFYTSKNPAKKLRFIC